MKKMVSLLLALLVIAGMLAVPAAAEGAKIFVQLQWALDQKAEWILLPGEAKYATTDADGNVTVLEAATEEYNIKLDYPADGSVPTLYLKNATVKATPEGLNSSDSRTVISVGRNGNAEKGIEGIFDFPFRIEVEGENTLATTNGSGLGVSCQQGITVAGSGKLTLVSDRMLYGMSSRTDVTFQNVTVDITSNMPQSQGLRPALWINKGSLTLDNAKLTLFANSGPAIWVSKTYNVLEGDPYNITVQNGSSVTATHAGTNMAAVACTGEFTIDSSSAEITAQGKCFEPKPILIDVGALGGTKASNAVEYNPKKGYTYFRCGTDIVIETEAPTTEPTTAPTVEATEPVTEPTTAPTTAPTIEPTTAPTEPTTAPTTGAPADVPVESTAAAVDADQTNDNTQTPNGNLIVYVILAVVIVGGIAAIAVILINQKKKV